MAENSEKSSASEEKSTHDGQESEGTIDFWQTKTFKYVSKLPILHEKRRRKDVYICLLAYTGLKSQHGSHKGGRTRHFEVANILEVYSTVPGV